MNIRDKRGFRRTPTEEILRAEEEKQKELQSIPSLPVAYVPTKSPEEYRKIAEEIAQKKQLHEEVKEETDGQKIERQSKVQMSELRQAYPEVYAKIFAMKSRITSSDGWTNCASWTEIWVLMEGFEKINRTLNLILNQLEANKDELEALTTVLQIKDQIAVKMPPEPENVGETVSIDEEVPIEEKVPYPKEMVEYQKRINEKDLKAIDKALAKFPTIDKAPKKRGMPKGGWPKK